jgi:hypothetical protein
MLNKLYPPPTQYLFYCCRKVFLTECIGKGEDGAARANEMAVKFEDHVFKTTRTKVLALLMVHP